MSLIVSKHILNEIKLKHITTQKYAFICCVSLFLKYIISSFSAGRLPGRRLGDNLELKLSSVGWCLKLALGWPLIFHNS